MKYLIKTIPDNENKVQVLKHITKNSYSLEWAFTLKKDDEFIELAEMYNEDCFVIANWCAWIRVYSISKKEMIFEKNFGAEVCSVIRISEDKTKLYISYDTAEYQPMLVIMSLTNFSILNTIVLPKEVETRNFTLVKKGKVLFYNPDFDEDKHGYHVLNLTTEKVTYFPMKYPQWEISEVPPPLLSARLNIGVMPNWHDIEIKGNESEGLVYVLKLVIFDLDSFEIMKNISVREFPVNQLGRNDYDNEEISNNLQLLDKEDEDYKEAVSDFITRNLCSIYFDDNNSFWLSFRGGIVRNVTLDGKLSPLLVTSFKPNSMVSGIFNFDGFHSFIDEIDGNNIVLREHDNDRFIMNFSDNELKSNQDVIAKEITEVPFSILRTKEEEILLAESTKVIVNIPNLNEESSYIEALDKIIVLTATINDVKSGDLLQFRIKDNERFEEEEEFFKKAIKVKGAIEKVVQIIKNFIEYKDAKNLYYDEETTALGYAIYFLAAQDEKYIDLAIKYITVFDDYEHDVFNRGYLIPLLFSEYKEKHGEYIIKQLSNLTEGECWVEEYVN